MWYRFAQFISDKGEDWYVKRIMAILYGPDWKNLPDYYEKFSEVLENLDSYKNDPSLKEILLQNILPKKPLIPEDSPPIVPEAPVATQPPLVPIPAPPILGYTGKLPPIHDHCHCKIETFGDRKTWQFQDKCCEECRQLAAAFNQQQSKQFDLPLIV